MKIAHYSSNLTLPFISFEQIFPGLLVAAIGPPLVIIGTVMGLVGKNSKGCSDRHTIDQVLIHHDGRMVFRFRNGTEVTR